MDAKNLDKVLNCPSLPSLPGVAIKMLELMRQPSCTADQIAQVIQNDPALASKVLRTVNSSYYGLSKPCPTITRAVSFLGLNTVKSLTLGLSLVDMGRGARAEFDLVAYWRRAVYGAAASRIIARLTRTCDPDEAFIAALLQDVGMLACFAALGTPYAVVVTGTADHEQLPKHERDQLGFDHAEAGARMAEKWRLPEQIIACTRYHHRGDAAPEPHAAMIRVVACSCDAAATLAAGEPQPKLAAFRRRMREWFNLDPETGDEVLHQTGAAARELSKLLELDTGGSVDVSAILAEAGEQLLHHQVEMERQQTELARQTVTDALTGAANRKSFDASMAGAFDEAKASGRALSVLFADADRFKTVNDTLGHQAGDAVLVEVSRRMREALGEAGTVCRYGGEEFAVILPGADLNKARQWAEDLRRAIEAKPIDIRPLGLSSPEVRQTISIGVATCSEAFSTWEALVHAADEAVYAAKKAGRNRVVCHGDTRTEPSARPAPPSPTTAASEDGRPTILIIEDDPLSAKMLEVLMVKHAQARTVVAVSAEDALKLLHGGRKDPALRPALVLIDLNLPTMSGLEFVRSCRSSTNLQSLKIVVMSACATDQQQSEATSAGATVFIDKSSLCADLGGSVRRLSDLARGTAKAA